MRVFVTGATGFIGSAVTAGLVDAGHQVLGLARSDSSAAALDAAGTEIVRGTIEDLDVLRTAASASDGVVHLAFHHDLGQHEEAARAELAAVETVGDALAGTGRPLVIASGGPVGTEQDTLPASGSPRVAAAQAALGLAARGVRSSVVRLAPTVHDEETCGMVQQLIGAARRTGFSGYLGNGANCWPSVHRLDAARLFRLALEQAPAGSVLHGVGEEGVPLLAIAEAVGRHLDVPTKAVAPEDAVAHFGFLARILGNDMTASNTFTRELLGWQPVHRGLLEDLDQGCYFA
ncbi:SDR family oxidoreductase [Streptacidiphilus jiangxiensis]|uniref:Nucleoside-diphosphate-sugar epimerase n=1 Tax=Streptacidiphilus jiangxiensis TaxID=235985 RepID=A0A1H7TAK7_STRJI|nr:SDR family oxidoreductase [Streptacidiphilus jiangxiensis]SEL81763.1 Nucleoside-diphosphate-sugar epimerase [Streptacidiphilus jiangxiensis]